MTFNIICHRLFSLRLVENDHHANMKLFFNDCIIAAMLVT